MGKISKLLSKGDIFGGQWGITFGGADKHKTVIGFFCTLLYLVVCIGSFIYFWGQYTDTANPQISSEVLIGSEFPQLNFGNYSFFFTISAIYEGRPLHYAEIQKIVKIELETVIETVDSATGKIKDVSTPHLLHQCKEEDFFIGGKKIETSEATIKGDYTICPNEKDLKMKGHAEDPEFQFIRLQFSPCETGCWTNLTTELENFHIQFGFIEAAIDVADYNSPFKFHLNKEHVFNLDEKVEYFRKLFFRTLEVDTDQGNFVEDIKSDISLDLFNLIYEDGHRHTANIPYLDVRLFSSNHNLFVKRDYVKFQDFLGNIGGVTSIAAIAIAILYSFLNETSLKLYIMNDTLFKHHVLKTGKKITMMHVLKFFLYKFFGKCCGCFSEETKNLSTLYFNGDETLDDNMDVRNLVQNSNDIQIIKKILFNTEQVILLNQVLSNDLIRKVEGDNDSDEEEKGRGEVMDRISQAESYLKKTQGSDDIEKRINAFLKEKLDSNKEYEKKKSMMGSKKNPSHSSVKPKKLIFQKSGDINGGNNTVSMEKRMVPEERPINEDTNKIGSSIMEIDLEN